MTSISSGNVGNHFSGFDFAGNPLFSPPSEVIEPGTAAVLDYLCNQAWLPLETARRT